MPFFNGTHLKNNTEVKEAFLRVGSPEIYIDDMLGILPCPISVSIDTLYQSSKSLVDNANSNSIEKKKDIKTSDNVK
ncbi:hypothetical protein HK099_005447 [Clydaea vesicula]|uniref:Uncharacterized protein n=1 Tax=Clydaea vesicula TaxID=447962 RepID=A0AAD5XUZ5_9FUNG|nr:hypothetical protein HK099_005447 [Clydaea vesicula]